jgi:hypothetical protein
LRRKSEKAEFSSQNSEIRRKQEEEGGQGLVLVASFRFLEDISAHTGVF